MKTSKTLISILLLLNCFSLFGEVFENDAVINRQQEISSINTSLDSSNDNVAEHRDRLRLLREQARSEIVKLTIKKTDFEEQLKSLGEPTESDVTEPAEVTDRRKELKESIASAGALLTQSKLNVDDSTRLLKKIADKKIQSFKENLFKKNQNIFTKTYWLEISKETKNAGLTLGQHLKKWNTELEASDRKRSTLSKVVLIFGFIGFFLLYALKRIKSYSKSLLHKFSNSEIEPQIAFLTTLLLRTVALFIVGIIVLSLINNIGLSNEAFFDFLKKVFYLSLTAITTYCAISSLLLKSNTRLRMLPIHCETSAYLRPYIRMAIACTLIGYILIYLVLLNSETDFTPVANILHIINAGLIAFVLFKISRPHVWKQAQDRSDLLKPRSVDIWLKLKSVLPVLMLMILISLVLGYSNFSSFVAYRTVMLFSLFAVYWVLRKSSFAFLEYVENRIKNKEDDGEKQSGSGLFFWIGLVVDLAFLVLLIPLILLLSGMDKTDVSSLMQDTANGFSVGNITISISDIFSAIVTFLVVIILFRLVQKLVDTRFFSSNSADLGFRNSFKTLFGYLGVILAFFAAIGVLGLDLSNLAIIAGALSLGIGFGLQSIVNNFVSGLILLFERPVKVGDWVVTQSGEGFIKSISVRSTEIETFDQASVIVPNSELISSSVQNWTHKDRGGRVVIHLGVSYSSDMNLVRDILLKCAQEHPLILKTPAPNVYFRDFGQSSLDVDLRFYVTSIPDGIPVRSEMRFNILAAFRKNGVEIPFPQRDVHIIKEDADLVNEEINPSDSNVEE